MHATASVDCLLQISGESVFELEDCEVRLHAGDWLVVNGAMHSWRNYIVTRQRSPSQI
jgi:hypothetical protein